MNFNPSNKNTILKKPTASSPVIKNDDIKDNSELLKQNNLLLLKYENDVEQIKEVQNLLYKITGLMQTFSEKILDQDIVTDQSLKKKI